MRFIFLLGGAFGFVLGAGTAFWMERSPDRIFLDGAIGCLVGALLFRWLWKVLLAGLHEAIVARQRATVGETPEIQPANPLAKS
ncbi:MAG: hypothetical protein Q8M02_15740 [Candidatus Didemnitutus sp.]|nr:hypothetical protein [Candidatus Didemnitutus sp.]